MQTAVHRHLLAILLLSCSPAPEGPSAPPAPAPRAFGAPAAGPAEAEPLPPPRDREIEVAGVVLVERVIGGAPTEPLPLIVALHGLGDDPRSFLGLFEGMALHARVASARGIDPYPNGGYAWLPPLGGRELDRRADPLQRAVTALEPAIRELAGRDSTCGAPVVTGFSQGGMLAFALAVRESPAVGEAIPVSGLLPPRLRPRPGTATDRPRVTALHGAADRVVPIAPARATVAALRAAGYRADLREHPGVGHTIDRRMRDELEQLLRRACREACAQRAADEE